MKLKFLSIAKKETGIVLRTGGIMVFSLFMAFLITYPASAQFGSAEEIACTSSGGSYYLNVDCNSGGLPPGFMSSCWICEPANTSWCSSAGGTPVWSPIDAEMAGGYWDCIMPQTCTANSACAATTCGGSTCADTCGNSYAGTQNCTPPPTTCADLGQVGTFPACSTPPPTYSEASYVPTYSQSYYQSSYAPTYSEASYYAEGSYAPSCTSPTVSITASPSRVKSGQTSTLTITGSGISGTCTIAGPGVSQSFPASSCAVSGTVTTPAITARSNYTVTCDGGATAKASVLVPFGVMEF